MSGRGETELSAELKRAFLNLVSRLEPENLACDGECSAAETRKRKRACLREWAALEKKAGRSVSESEAWESEVW